MSSKGILDGSPTLKGDDAPIDDKARLDWLEANHTLHKQVEILYVVDGYEVTLVHEDGFTPMSPAFHGADLREAIDAAIREGGAPIAKESHA